MRALQRFLAACLLAIAFALPGVTGEGGPGGGSTGVWVLPMSAYLGDGPLGAPRDAQSGIDVTVPLLLRASGEGAGLTATFCDDLTAEPIALPVAGDVVTIPANVLQALAQRSGARADVVIADEAMRGYVVRITIAANRTATVRVY